MYLILVHLSIYLSIYLPIYMCVYHICIHISIYIYIYVVETEDAIEAPFQGPGMYYMWELAPKVGNPHEHPRQSASPQVPDHIMEKPGLQKHIYCVLRALILE